MPSSSRTGADTSSSRYGAYPDLYDHTDAHATLSSHAASGTSGRHAATPESYDHAGDHASASRPAVSRSSRRPDASVPPVASGTSGRHAATPEFYGRAGDHASASRPAASRSSRRPDASVPPDASGPSSRSDATVSSDRPAGQPPRRPAAPPATNQPPRGVSIHGWSERVPVPGHNTAGDRVNRALADFEHRYGL